MTCRPIAVIQIMHRAGSANSRVDFLESNHAETRWNSTYFQFPEPLVGQASEWCKVPIHTLPSLSPQCTSTP